MPVASVTVEIEAQIDEVFDLIHDYARRLEWDPFLREAKLLGSATAAGRGVASRCVARRGLGGRAMETVYVSFDRPGVAAVTMKRGPFFLAKFAASIRQEAISSSRTRVTYRYLFTCRPRWLAPLIDPIVQSVFHRETSGRLAALKRFLESRPGRSSPATTTNKPHDSELEIPIEELHRRAEQFQGRPLQDLLSRWEHSK